jgi:hypothetical protein
MMSRRLQKQLHDTELGTGSGTTGTRTCTYVQVQWGYNHRHTYVYVCTGTVGLQLCGESTKYVCRILFTGACVRNTLVSVHATVRRLREHEYDAILKQLPAKNLLRIRPTTSFRA